MYLDKNKAQLLFSKQNEENKLKEIKIQIKNTKYCLKLMQNNNIK